MLCWVAAEPKRIVRSFDKSVSENIDGTAKD